MMKAFSTLKLRKKACSECHTPSLVRFAVLCLYLYLGLPCLVQKEACTLRNGRSCGTAVRTQGSHTRSWSWNGGRGVAVSGQQPFSVTVGWHFPPPQYTPVPCSKVTLILTLSRDTIGFHTSKTIYPVQYLTLEASGQSWVVTSPLANSSSQSLFLGLV